jgi:hypothetical protein
MSLQLDSKRWRWRFTLIGKLQGRKGCSIPSSSGIRKQFSDRPSIPSAKSREVALSSCGKPRFPVDDKGLSHP